MLSNPTFVEAATRNIRDGDTYTYLGSLKQFTSGSGRGFRVLATSMRVHADYFSNNTSGVGELELGQYRRNIRFYFCIEWWNK